MIFQLIFTVWNSDSESRNIHLDPSKRQNRKTKSSFDMFNTCLFIGNCLYFCDKLQYHTSRVRIRRILFGWTWTVYITSWIGECWQTIHCWHFDHSWLGNWCRMVSAFVVYFSKLALCSYDEFNSGSALLADLLFFHSRISKDSFPIITACTIPCRHWLQSLTRQIWKPLQDGFGDRVEEKKRLRFFDGWPE